MEHSPWRARRRVLGEDKMKIKRDSQIEGAVVEMEGAKDVTMKILIGPDDGSQNIIMRLFTVSPGGHTPYHTHDFEHLVKVLAGKGVVVDKDGNKHDLSPGQNVFVEPNEKHQFANPHSEPLEMTCTIPNPDLK
jgi:quercetin dioxygenase-like cupin family protein